MIGIKARIKEDEIVMEASGDMLGHVFKKGSYNPAKHIALKMFFYNYNKYANIALDGGDFRRYMLWRKRKVKGYRIERLSLNGLTNREIGKRVGLSTNAVRNMRTRTFRMMRHPSIYRNWPSEIIKLNRVEQPAIETMSKLQKLQKEIGRLEQRRDHIKSKLNGLSGEISKLEDMAKIVSGETLEWVQIRRQKQWESILK